MINIPLKRWGKPEDIEVAVVFMASPASGWVTGQCLFVSGDCNKVIYKVSEV